MDRQYEEYEVERFERQAYEAGLAKAARAAERDVLKREREIAEAEQRYETLRAKVREMLNHEDFYPRSESRSSRYSSISKLWHELEELTK